MSNLDTLLAQAKEELFKDPKYAKSTNEIVKYLNGLFPKEIRFVASNNRTSLDTLTRDGGIYRIKINPSGTEIQLFKNWNTMFTNIDDKWYNKFTKKIKDEKEINKYAEEARERRREVVKQYSNEPDQSSQIKNALTSDPKFKMIVARSNLSSYEDGEGSTKDSKTLLWIYDFYNKLKEDDDLLLMDASNWNALATKNYTGDYRMIGSTFVTSEQAVIKFVRNQLKLTPIIKAKAEGHWFEYPSDQEMARVAANQPKTKSSSAAPAITATTTKDTYSEFKTSRIALGDEQPEDYGFKESSGANVTALRKMLLEFWVLLTAKVSKDGFENAGVKIKVLQDSVKEMIFGEAKVIASGTRPPKNDTLDEIPEIKKLIKGYFTKDRYDQFRKEAEENLANRKAKYAASQAAKKTQD